MRRPSSRVKPYCTAFAVGDEGGMGYCERGARVPAGVLPLLCAVCDTLLSLLSQQDVMSRRERSARLHVALAPHVIKNLEKPCIFFTLLLLFTRETVAR